ncbi:recQ [Mytilus coruscus]|uniref:RecQ n=1 Tax=Mytilus coruscus TaxID=42192 RepID=A0A6J8DJI1_MYTCO|nr:recQ [Mytilus coruscus]
MQLKPLLKNIQWKRLNNTDKNTHNEERRKDIFICTLCGTENTRRKLVCEGCKKREGIKVARTKKSDGHCSTVSSTNTKTASKTQEISISDNSNQDEIQDTSIFHQIIKITYWYMFIFLNEDSSKKHTSLVISPLKALMKDQISSLRERNIPSYGLLEGAEKEDLAELVNWTTRLGKHKNEITRHKKLAKGEADDSEPWATQFVADASTGTITSTKRAKDVVTILWRQHSNA